MQINDQHAHEQHGDLFERLLAASHVSLDRVSHDAVLMRSIPARPLKDIYLEQIEDPALKQSLKCQCCFDFFRLMGGLVEVTVEGEVRSVFWHAEEEGLVGQVLNALCDAVEGGKLTSLALRKRDQYTIAQKGGFDHFHLPENHPIRTAVIRYNNQLPTEGDFQQAYQGVVTTFTEYYGNVDALDTLLELFVTGSFNHTRQMVQRVNDVKDFIGAVVSVTGRQRQGVLAYYAVSNPGVRHVPGSALGEVLDGLMAKRDIGAIRRRWNVLVSPENYLRPKAAPKEANIDRAEKLLEEMGARTSLRRRSLHMDELAPHAMWKQADGASTDSQGGVFDHLRENKQPTPLHTGTTVPISWVKFLGTVLPKANKIAAKIGTPISHLGGLTTAVDPDAPPILRWDSREKRNPHAHFVFNGTLGRHQLVGIPTNEVFDVPCITQLPCQWSGSDFYSGYFIPLTGVHAIPTGMGSALFPRALRPEFHDVRDVIEAHSNRTDLEDAAAGVYGFMVMENGPVNLMLQVTLEHTVVNYHIDRWD